MKEMGKRLAALLTRFWQCSHFAGEYIVMAIVPRAGPGPVMRWLFKLPILLYRMGLGRFVSNVLLLITVGRRSGRPRVTALGFSYEAFTDTYYVSAGWNGRTDWYRNARANPRVRVWVGRRKFDSVAEPVPESTAVRLLAEYSRRNPFASRIFPRWTGVLFDGSEMSLRVVAAHFPMIGLRARGRG